MRIHPIISLWIIIPFFLLILLYVWWKKGRQKVVLETLLLIFLFLINLRIQYPSDDIQTSTNNLDVLLVIDTTISMNALDGRDSKTRLDSVKEDVEYIIDNLNGARFALVTFDNKSRILIPYIRDTQMIFHTAQGLKVLDRSYARGSNISVSIDSMKKALESANKEEDRIQVVFYFSDGEITNEEKRQSFSSLASYIDEGAVLGYGTEKGARMKVANYAGDGEEYLPYYGDGYTNNIAFSKYEEKNLTEIAKEMKIDYFHLTDTKDFKKKIEQIKKSTTSNEDGKETGYGDLYYLFVIPLFFLLLLEMRKTV